MKLYFVWFGLLIMAYLTPLQRKKLGIDVPGPDERKTNPHLESKQQISCVEWFSYQYPRYKKKLYANPNGGKRKKTEASIMKAEGTLSGLFDQTLMVARRGYHGMYVEQKIEGGEMSQNQWSFMLSAMEEGYHVAVVWSKEMFIDAINWYMNE